MYILHTVIYDNNTSFASSLKNRSLFEVWTFELECQGTGLSRTTSTGTSLDLNLARPSHPQHASCILKILDGVSRELWELGTKKTIEFLQLRGWICWMSQSSKSSTPQVGCPSRSIPVSVSQCIPMYLGWELSPYFSLSQPSHPAQWCLPSADPPSVSPAGHPGPPRPSPCGAPSETAIDS